jgi:DUF1680 family protein
LNKRLHQLQPREEYAAEMERSIFNVGIAALGPPGSGGEGPNGTGIRYFANQHKQKQNPSMHASCCEGQGSRLFGSLPKFIYTLQGDNNDTRVVYVDIYAASVLSIRVQGLPATVQVDTSWPYSSEVSINVTLAQASLSLVLALRMPSWLADPVGITVNGQTYPASGVPGISVYRMHMMLALHFLVILQLQRGVTNSQAATSTCFLQQAGWRATTRFNFLSP